MHRQRRRRRRKTNQSTDTNPPWHQLNVNPYRRFSERFTSGEHRTTSQLNNTISGTNDATIIRINQSENPFISRQGGSIRNMHSSRNAPSERSYQLNLSTLNRDEISRPLTTIDRQDFIHSNRVRRVQTRASTVSVSRIKRSSSVKNRIRTIPINKKQNLSDICEPS